MKIVIIGSTQYADKFLILKKRLEASGHEVNLPALDDHPGLDDLGVCEYNRRLIEWADEVRVIWDARSFGTWGDFMMAFALRKKVVIEYIEPKTMAGVMRKYADTFISQKGDIQ